MFLLTKAGGDLVAHPGRLLSEMVPDYLFRLDHGAHLRSGRGELVGNWDVFLNVINVEADQGTSLGKLRAALYGRPDPEAQRYDDIGWTFYTKVLRPLCWAGLLQTAQLGRMAWMRRSSRRRSGGATCAWRRTHRSNSGCCIDAVNQRREQVLPVDR